jgi:hypothetical protein
MKKSFLSLVALSLLLIIISCNKGKAGDGKTGAEKSDTDTTTEKLKPLTIDTVDFNKEWWLLATMTPRVDGL